MSALTLSEVKNWLRYDDTASDTSLQIMLDAGVTWIENYTGHLFTQREVTESVSPADYFDLRWKPYEADSLAVGYTDSAFASQSFAGFSIYPMNGTYRVGASEWPTAKGLTLTYTAGYADADDIPEDMAMALAVWTGMSDEDRNKLSSEGMTAIHYLLGHYRLPVLA